MKKWAQKQTGFTIVELLIVVVVIAILAAVTTVAYNGVQRSTAESTVKSDLSSGTKILETSRVESGSDKYPLQVSSARLPLSPNNDYQYEYDSATNSYCLTIFNYKFADLSQYRQSNGSQGKGACPGHTSGPLSQVNSWKQVSSGGAHSCAINQNDMAYCWGYNGYGNLGTNSYGSSSTPVPVYTGGALAGKTFKKIEAGGYVTCAIASDDKVYCWGYAPYGVGSVIPSVFAQYPVRVGETNLPANYVATDISVSNYGHACMVTSTQVAYCWGINAAGSVGDGTTTAVVEPKALNGSGGITGKAITNLSAGFQNTCALANGELYCWGGGRGNTNGADTSKRYIPYPADKNNALAGKTITSVASSNAMSCVVADKKVYCWGYETAIGNGVGPSNNITTPTLVTAGFPSNYEAKAVYAEQTQTCATLMDNSLWCWVGDNGGAIDTKKYFTGNEAAPLSNTPVKVTFTNSVVINNVSVGDNNVCVTSKTGAAYCWGHNKGDKLGISRSGADLYQTGAAATGYMLPGKVLDPQ